MGAWLSSLHVRSENRKLVCRVAESVAATHGCKLFLCPARRGWTTLLADFQSLSQVAVDAFATQVGVPMFHCLVADDDDFRYQFFRDGALIDRYSSNPDAYGDDIPLSERNEWRGVPEHFVELLGGIRGVEKCVGLLRQPHGSDDASSFVFESERLARFAKLLGFSHSQVAYSDLEADEMFPGRRQFKHVPDDSAAKADARAKFTSIRAEYRRLIKVRILFTDLRPPGGKREAHRVSPEWIFDPSDSSMLLWWTKYFSPSNETGFRIKPPEYCDLEPLDVTLPREIRALKFSRSGLLLAVALFGAAELWRWPSREVVGRIEHERVVSWPRFDSAERALVLAGTSEITVWDISSESELARMRLEEAPSSFAVHPSGEIAVCGMQNGLITFRELPSLQLSKRLATHRGILDSTEHPVTAQMRLIANRPPDLDAEEANAWFMRNVNPERFAALLFSPDGEWLFAGTNLGMRAWRWRKLIEAAAGKAPAPDFACDARPSPSSRGHSYCYTLAFDDKNQRLLFAGMEGIIQYLDLLSGQLGNLLRPPELLAIYRLDLSPDSKCLGVQANEFKINSLRSPEVRLWNYPALCAAAAL